jgi:hypothetical protein
MAETSGSSGSSESVEAYWSHKGGDLRAAAEVTAAAGKEGALLAVEIERISLEGARRKGLSREREGELMRRAWRKTLETLPAVEAGNRTGWSRFEFILEGDRTALTTLGRRLLEVLKNQAELKDFAWHVTLTALFTEQPRRTLMCDPAYVLRRAAGESALAWVEPYAGADWQEPQRYPTVTFVEPE